MPIKKPIDPPAHQAHVQPIAVDEHAAAQALGVSVHYLRKDRRTKRLIPFYKIGSDIVRYNLPRVLEALAACEQGGPQKKGRTAKALA